MRPRIPNHTIDQIKAATDIVEVIGSRVSIKPQGKDEYFGLCPFHNENTPSFTVTPSKQLFCCFGCGAAGNAIEFVRRFEGVSFPDALEQLAIKAGLPSPKVQAQPSAVDVIRPAMKLYQSRLFAASDEGLKARNYLAQRGISTEVAKEFGLGLAPAQRNVLRHQLNHRTEDLLTIGLLDKEPGGKRIYERFGSRLIIPIRNSSGQDIAATGRALGAAKQKYLNTQQSEWFQKSKLVFGLSHYKRANRASAGYKGKKIYVVEGPLDVVVGVSAGEKRIVGCLGRSISINQLNILLSVSETVVFAFDGDAAGNRAITDTINLVLESSSEASRIKFKRLPEGLDPGEIFCKQGFEAFASLEEVGFIQAVLNELPPPTTADTVLERAEKGIEMILKCADPIVRCALTSALAHDTGFSVASIEAKIAKSQSSTKQHSLPTRSAGASADQSLAMEVYSPPTALWRALIEEPRLVGELALPFWFEHSKRPLLRALHMLSEQARSRTGPMETLDVINSLKAVCEPAMFQRIYQLPAPAQPAEEAKSLLLKLELDLVDAQIQKHISRISSGATITEAQRESYISLVTKKKRLMCEA